MIPRHPSTTPYFLLELQKSCRFVWCVRFITIFCIPIHDIMPPKKLLFNLSLVAALLLPTQYRMYKTNENQWQTRNNLKYTINRQQQDQRKQLGSPSLPLPLALIAAGAAAVTATATVAVATGTTEE